MSPIVSVVMPFFNAERYLADAIESVRAQTLAEWELLLVDDGSVDGSRAISEKFVRAEPKRIKLIVHPQGGNHGPAIARNLGIVHAAGEFIAFLDADDLFLPGKLASEVAILSSTREAAMLYSPTHWWWENGLHADYIENLGVAAERIHGPPDLVRRVLLRKEGAPPCTCGVLIRREAIVAVGSFEPRFLLYEDQTLWVKLFLRYPVYVSSHCHARYRQHSASTSEAAKRTGEYHRWKPHQAHLAFLQWMESYVVTNGVVDAHLKKAIDLAFAPYQYPLLWRASRLPRRIVGSLRRKVMSNFE
jgi:glycosyltransferase involved in cell wall biosynthesis